MVDACSDVVLDLTAVLYQRSLRLHPPALCSLIPRCIASHPVQLLAGCVRTQTPPFPQGDDRIALATATLQLMFSLGSAFMVGLCPSVITPVRQVTP